MATKYDAFIELVPGYESVVRISSDSKDADFWSHYIVNDDMVTAVKLIAKSLRPDDPGEDVWHYWLKGSYGTGKTYSAIVIKHLLQDDYKTVEAFLNKNPLFFEVKDKFLSARRKGRYFVKFRSGECRQLDTSNKFLFQIEQSVREILRENGFEYTGRNSLIDSVKKKIEEFKPTLAQRFEEGAFFKYWGTYGTFEAFYRAVIEGDVFACSNAQAILQEMDIGLATDLQTFKVWLKDVYDGNAELSKTGIFIIWDEFTDYIRFNDLDIIQQLSLFSKEVPFFMLYVMHEYPGSFSDNVSKELDKADARFHKIDMALSEKTTIKLIGESIITRDGMRENWANVCDELYGSISGSISSFMGDPDSDLDAQTLKKIFPIHPMTVTLVSKVAGMAASNRSIFEFLKSSGDDGFRAYIHANGQYDWKWVTPDYLWDYFFVNNQGGRKEMTLTAKDALKHYSKVKDQINDDRILRVFKCAMLLLATIGSGHNLKRTRIGTGIQSTEKTLCDCFSGMLNQEEISKYLGILSTAPLNLLVLAPDRFEGRRIELPYSGTSGELEAEVERIRKNNSPGDLFKSESLFGSMLKKQFVPEEKAVVKRLLVDTCWWTQISSRYDELKKNIDKNLYQFGLLIIAASSIEEIGKAKSTVAKILVDDEPKRILVCVLRYTFTRDALNNWYELMANGQLAQNSGNTVNADSYRSQANELIGEWVSTAIGKEMVLLYENSASLLYTNKEVLSQYEKIVFKVFPAAPEGIIKKITLYKTANIPAYYGVSKTTIATKNPANDKQKNFNQQWQDCVEILKDPEENVWDCSSMEEVMALGNTAVGRCMSELCKTLDRSLTSGTVLLSDLWTALQGELGYYNTGVCCYLLGFAMHFYIGKYTWFDGNNAHKLDEETIPTLINAMLAGKSAGMKLSSESDIEKRFKDITKRIFGLSQEEVGDVYDCRKNVKIHITQNGYPIWAVKYLDDGEYAGIKTEISEIIDKYMNYILEIGNQSEVMEDIVRSVRCNAKVYISILSDFLKDKQKLVYGMKNFIYQKAAGTKAVCDKYGFSMQTLFTMLTQILEEEKWQWKEEKVIAEADHLTLDLTLVGVINKILDGKAQSVEKVTDTLSNYLGYIRVPGCVYATLEADWASTVATLHELSMNKWVSYSNEKKTETIKELEQNMAETIENIAHPFAVLKTYIEQHRMGTFSDAEYQDILQALPNESFEQTENNFKTNIRNKIKELTYTKKVQSLMSIWREKTNEENVSAWETKNIMPITWGMPCFSDLFSVILSLGRNERIDDIRLENALTTIKDGDLSPLSDVSEMDKQFILNVSAEKYMGILLPHIKELKSAIQNNGFRNYSLWNNHIVAIRQIVEQFITVDLRSEVGDRAKKMLEEIGDLEVLKKHFDRILEQSAEACLLLLNEE